MPAVNFAECAGDERSGDDTAVDKQIVNLESIGTPIVAGSVERANLAGEVALETTDAGEQTSQREEKCHVESHQKMSGRHEQRADRDRPGASEQTIGDQAAGDRGQINETG